VKSIVSGAGGVSRSPVFSFAQTPPQPPAYPQ
jgi:hypothetical protein